MIKPLPWTGVRFSMPGKRESTRLVGTMVPKKGLEPPRPCGHMDLNHARLPIPPLRQVTTAARWSCGTTFQERIISNILQGHGWLSNECAADIASGSGEMAFREKVDHRNVCGWHPCTARIASEGERREATQRAPKGRHGKVGKAGS